MSVFNSFSKKDSNLLNILDLSLKTSIWDWPQCVSKNQSVLLLLDSLCQLVRALLLTKPEVTSSIPDRSRFSANLFRYVPGMSVLSMVFICFMAFLTQYI